VTTTTYHVSLGDRAMRVQLRRDGDAVFVRVDDADEVRADLRQLHGDVRALRVGDRRLEVAADSPEPGRVRLAIAGLVYDAEVIDEARARLVSVAGGRSASHAHVELRAPMPGLLVKVLCQPGDQVQANQPLVVLQAMKMENELSLPRPGTVAELKAAAGQTVEQGQVLVILD
jgi:biotin carboxyl carrier protein